MKKIIKLIFYFLFFIAIAILMVFLVRIYHFNSNLLIENEDFSISNNLEIVTVGLDTPWAIDFLPDGTLIFTERLGNVNLIVNGKVENVAKIDVFEISESGLLGIAVDPQFVDNHFVYLYYTLESGNRVSRFNLIDKKLSGEKILLDKIPNARFHDGGRIKFGPDEKLYITTGDATVPSSAQDLDSLAGKILRMNRDGSIPEDNLFNNYVYSYGHRNSQGLAWLDEKLYSSEHGPTKNDEINLIEMGNDYGWPNTCINQAVNTIKPIKCYTNFTLAPGSLASDEKSNVLYVSGLRGNQLRKIILSEDGETILEEKVLFSDLGRIREVILNENYLYFTTSNYDGRGLPQPDDDKIMRVKIR
jgi:aldose sugar dehydrogenase